ncbi:hypothetical protein GQ53DRAFT_830706 [Thozetella sp. PMI_491]|nr:hypothetical protein GQ53DRAFT_830706 [Thozetella sp. PMI_491]
MWRIAVFLIALIGLAIAAPEVNIKVAQAVPKDASQIVDQSFLGFATEAASFPNFTNLFSQNLFNVFYNATGAPVIFRVGGTSMDHSIFDLYQEEDWQFPKNRTDNLQSNITFGKHWFRGFRTLENIKFMLHVPLARHNLTNAVKFTRHCLKIMGTSEKLHALEIGNEVDVYAKQGARSNQTWDPAQYAHEVKNYMDLLTNNVSNVPKSGRIFQLYDKGTEIDFPTNANWTINHVLGNLTKAVDMTRVKQIAEHYYQAKGKRGATLQGTLLNHTNTTSFMQNEFQRELNALPSMSEIDFVLSEVGNTLGSSGNHTADLELAAGLGATVWTVDWMLYAMSMNVKRINMQMGRTFTFAAWQPNEVNNVLPHLHAPFHGHVFVANFISARGQLQVARLNSPSSDVSAYAGYHGGQLAKVALLNLEFWKQGSSSKRPTMSVTIDLGLDSDVKQATVRKLWGLDSVALDGVTWAGTTWPYNATGMPVVVRNDTETVDVKNGKVLVTIEATTAVLVDWGASTY